MILCDAADFSCRTLYLTTLNTLREEEIDPVKTLPVLNKILENLESKLSSDVCNVYFDICSSRRDSR